MFGTNSFGGFGQQNQQAAPNMFGQANTTQSGFGTNNAFGQSTAPAPAAGTSAFGAQTGSVFGQPAQQPAQTSSFSFGQSTFGAQKPATGFGGTFGSAPAQQPTTSFGFGAQPQQTQTGAFGSAFGGAPAQTATSSFGFGAQQPAAQPAFGGGGFGVSQQTVTQGSATVPYAPFREDATPNETKPHAKSYEVHQSIVSMPAYTSVSPEELRLQDIRQGRGKGTAAPAAAPAAGAAAPAATGTSFGFGQAAQPAQSGSLFGQSQPAQSSLFGAKPAGGAFGAGGSTFGSGTSAFGQPAAQTGSLFGQSQPAQPQTSLFGQSQPAQPQTSLFGQSQPAAQPAQPASTGFSFGQSQPAQPASTGFSFGQSQPAQPASTGFSFGANNANKPAFGGFGQNQSSGFSFGANNNTNTANTTGTAFGANNTSTTQPSTGFSFGNNAAKPGGLFGNSAAAPSTSTFGGFGANNNNQQQNKPAFSFGGGFGGASTGTTGAATTGTTGTGTTGGLFGGAGSTTGAAGTAATGATGTAGTGGFSFGQPQNTQNTQTGTGLFGAKPAAPATGLFGSSQPSTLGTNTNTGGGLFGAQANKPAFSFGAGASTGTGAAPAATGTTGGLFGASSTTTAPLFGQSQPAGTGFGAQSSLFGANKPLGASAPAPAAAATPAQLTTNPYGTDALLTGVTIPAGAGAAAQAPLPFNVAPKNKPPLVSPFRSSPRNAVRVTRLRGSTPADLPSGRERTPGLRESTPALSVRATTPARAGSVNLFRAPSDARLTPQALVPRSNSKRLVLDESFASPNREGTPGLIRSRSSVNRARFSPAVERVTKETPAPADADVSTSFVLPPVRPREEPARPPKEGEYYMEPSLAALRALPYNDLASVSDFTVGRVGIGRVVFREPVDLTDVPDLSDIPGGIVQLRAKEIFVYPQEEDLESDTPLDGLRAGYVPVPKAPQGTALNVPARVSLERCWPLDRATREPLTDEANVRVKQHINRLKNKSETEFVSYEAKSGTWTFDVAHFSRYGLDSSDEDAEEDEEDEDAPPAAALAMDEEESDSMHESELDSPPEWEPVRHATPARLRASTPGAEARKVQVMRASFFGQAPPTTGLPVGGVTEGAWNAPPRQVSVRASVERGASAMPIDEEDEEDAAVDELLDREPLEEIGGATAPPPPPIPVVVRPYAQTAACGALVALDAGLSFGRSFRAGFGPHGAYAWSPELGKLALGRTPTPGADLERLLKIQLDAASIQSVDGVPVAECAPGTRFATVAAHFSREDRSFSSQLWHLLAALFDPIDLETGDATDDVASRIAALRRKAAFSEWLQHAVAGTVQSESRAHVAASRSAELVHSLLSGFQVAQAAEAAVDVGDIRLATLVAQAGGDLETREHVAAQLAVWRDEGTDAYIDRRMRRVYSVLAGDVSDASGLDWKRALGMHVWYGTEFEAPLRDAVDAFEAAVRAPGSSTAPPVPHYRVDAQLGSLRERELHAKEERDAMYELLRVAVDPAHPLEAALNARSFGPSAADDSLPWHVYIVLARALRARDFTDAIDAQLAGTPASCGSGARLTLAYAAQLEDSGLWQWAAFVLLFLDTAAARAASLQALLARNVESIDAHTSFLVDTLHIPQAWLWKARAVAAHARGDLYEEHKCLLEAQDLAGALRVAVKELATEAIIRGDQSLLIDLFAPFSAWEEAARAEDRSFDLEGWDTGRMLLDYATLPQVIPSLLVQAAGSRLSASERDALDQAVARTHELIERVPAHFGENADLAGTVARTEMLAVLHNIARLVSNTTDAPPAPVRWSATAPPEAEQLHACASDFANAILGSV
ncbi:hypothetical protein MCUN1_002437 [Malassezia cuniculi]|uniref:Peptidase S59 domain-containing protein n=1 Tax=Malassezia cuniculi TaxID=948313 RepID=A0AAF0JBS2_9BASI|nr:hypothetical protein MCUN1_002437 [Malassezia cuniculi]